MSPRNRNPAWKRLTVTRGTTLLPVLAAVACGIASVSARELPKFEDLDQNDDGRLSVEEASADPDIAARFAQADLDRSGYLSREEFDQRAQP